MFSFLSINYLLSNEMVVEIVLLDVIDNQIETKNTKLLDRKKRDLDDVKKTRSGLTGSEKDEHLFDPNEHIDRSVPDEVKRKVRQLRPPPLGQPAWEYKNNYELTNIHRTPQSSELISDPVFGRDQGISNINYNPFLVPPSSRPRQIFKNGGSNDFVQISPFGNTYTSGKGAKSNAVTELNSHKPFTVHTSFELDDAQAQYNEKNSAKEGFTTHDTFYQLDSPKPLKPLRPTAINMPDNFSYYHIGNTGSKTERDSFKHRLTQQPLQQTASLIQPQVPIYYVNKPSKLHSASTPKNHYIQFSTVGGFFNNNPTAFTPIAPHKNQKNILSAEKYGIVTHRPVYRDSVFAPVLEPFLNDDLNYEIRNVDQPYFRQSAVRRPISTSSNPPYFKGGEINGNDTPSSLFTYHVTTDDTKIPLQNKSKGFYVTHNSKGNSANVKVVATKQAFEHSVSPEKQNSTGERPSGPDITANKFNEANRESQRTQITKPKQVSHFRTPPNDETASILNAEDYYYYDNDEEIMPTTIKKRPIEVDHTTYRIDQRYTPTTKSTKPTTSEAPNSFSDQSNIKKKQYETITGPQKNQLPQEYFEYDEDDDYDGEYEFKYKLPPVNVSKFMPMSETAAPRPAYMITTTSRPMLSSTSRKHLTPSYTRNYITKQPVSSIVPPIIKFPEEIFQGVRPMYDLDSNVPRYLNQSTLRPYTVRTRSQTTEMPSKTYKLLTKIPQTTTRTTETTTPKTTITTGKAYSFRPNTKTRGQNNSNLNRLTKASMRPNSLKKHLWELDERLPNRYTRPMQFIIVLQ